MCNTLQHTATHCNTLQHTATHCNILQHTATHCNTLQHTATHCNTLQHTATHYTSNKSHKPCTVLQYSSIKKKTTNESSLVRPLLKFLYIKRLIFCFLPSWSPVREDRLTCVCRGVRETLHHIGTQCNALQHCNSSLLCVMKFMRHYNILQHTAAHCSILQHTATHCKTLQHTATYCNTLQHTAPHCTTR